jgi:hypothetical protein
MNAVLETHVHVLSTRDTHVAECVSRQERTCTCVSDRDRGGGRRLLAEQRKSLQDLLQVHDLPWHELGNGESDYVY